MSTSELKSNLHQLIDSITDSSTLQAIYLLLTKSNSTEKADWWDTIDDEEKASIERGLQQIENGEGIPHSQVMAKYERYL